MPLVTIIITQANTLPNKTEVNEIKRKVKNKQEVRNSERARSLWKAGRMFVLMLE